ncbi:MAG: MTH938/NDUFAF3 family protein [Candidatus Omnitrophica bacterium]|nr:MTH938/NDUFAF3 family protein [Candidatus Omnitrophota bacterium]
MYPPKIEKYNFGEIVIDGIFYAKDVIIYPQKINPSWWRKEGHSLFIEDIEEVLKEEPEVLIIGTGAVGLMQVSEKVKEKIKALNIELLILPTNKACQEYIKLSEKKKTIACLHLTC